MCITKIALLICFLVFSVNAASYTWTGTGADTSFGTADNWNPAGVPGTMDDATIDIADAVCTIDADTDVQSLIVNSDTATVTVSAALIVHTLDLQDGTIDVTDTGDVSGKNETSGAFMPSNDATFSISGVASIPIEISYGQLWVNKGADVSHIETAYSSGEVYVVPGSHVGMIHIGNGYSGNVFFEIAEADGDVCDIDSIESNDGEFNFKNGSTVVVKDYFNCTDSQTVFSGEGSLMLGEDSKSIWEYVDITEKVMVENMGWLETANAESNSYFYFNGQATFKNTGEMRLNTGIYFYSVENSFENTGTATTDNDDTNTYSCYFNSAFSSTSTEFPKVINSGDISCPTLNVQYVDLQNSGKIDVAEIEMYYATTTVTSDQENALIISGYGTVLLGQVTVAELHIGGSIDFISSGVGNSTITFYNGTSTSTWTGAADSFFIFDGEFYSSGTIYFESAMVEFSVNSKADTTGYFYFQDTTLYSQGDWVHSGSSFTFQNENCLWFNQGYLEMTSDWTLSSNDYSSGPDAAGTFINVGILKLTDGGSFYSNAGVCNGGKIILADSSDSTFSSLNYIYTYNRLALQGTVEIELGEKVDTDTFEFASQYVLYYYYSTLSAPEEFNDDGVPLTVTPGVKEYSVYSLADDDRPFVEHVDLCWYSNSLYIFSDDDDMKGYDCGDLPTLTDFELGMCDREDIPAATVDPGSAGPSDSSASGVVFSMLSVFIIAALFILF